MTSEPTFAAVDQPRPRRLYEMLRCSLESEKAPIIVPRFNSHRAHPVIVQDPMIPHLLQLDEERGGLRGLLDAHRGETAYVSCNPDWLRWDCNTPEQYQEALHWFRKQECR